MEDIDEPDDDLFEHHRITVDPGQDLIRIDRFLFARLPNVTRTKIQAGIKEGFVRVNNTPTKPNYRVRPGDVITVSFPEPPRSNEVIPEDIPLDIVYEDSELLVVNKPAGMVVHPAHQNWSGTLVNALTFHFSRLPEMPNNEGRPGLVHRIDKDTSGLLVIAKTERAMTHLARQFFEHTISRSYLALVWGVPDPSEGTIAVNLGRSPRDRRMTVAFPEGDQGRAAVKHYRVLKDLPYVSLVECRLETGRTHQIRAHMKYLGHPLFADSPYGGKEIVKGTVFSKYKQFVDICFKLMPRQALLAHTLGFIHPATKEFMEFTAELPADFSAVLQRWEQYVTYT